MTPDTYEDVHVTLIDGRKIYWPKKDMTRLAPAAVCIVTQRILELRATLKALEAEGKLDPVAVRQLNHIARELPGEAAWLSQDSLRVHNELKKIAMEDL